MDLNYLATRKPWWKFWRKARWYELALSPEQQAKFDRFWGDSPLPDEVEMYWKWAEAVGRHPLENRLSVP